ncbi:MAG: methoxymalonyl-ACP biosynthesis protein, partial [Sphingomonadales bacterium]
MPSLSWLPVDENWKAKFSEAKGEGALPKLAQLARTRIDFIQTMQIDRRLTALGADGAPEGLTPVKLAVLASSTIDQLLPSL